MSAVVELPTGPRPAPGPPPLIDVDQQLTVTAADLLALPPSRERDRLLRRAGIAARSRAGEGTGSTVTGDWQPPPWVADALAEAEQHRQAAEADRKPRRPALPPLTAVERAAEAAAARAAARDASSDAAWREFRRTGRLRV